MSAEYVIEKHEYSRHDFENKIAASINKKYYSVDYAIKRDKHGKYVKWETRVAWTWWCTALDSK